MGYFKIRYGPDGAHLFNRTTGTNVLIDEIVVPPERWAPAPRQISIALTNERDLSCSHCYAPKNSAKLELERLCLWIKELDLNGCLGIGFGGGEPTLYRDLVQLCKFAVNSTGLAVSMTTHAHHLSDKLTDDLRGNLHFIRVSMDGVGSTYERLRDDPSRHCSTAWKSFEMSCLLGSILS